MNELIEAVIVEIGGALIEAIFAAKLSLQSTVGALLLVLFLGTLIGCAAIAVLGGG